MQIRELIAAIEKIANPAWQADWDKSGFQVISTRSEIHHVCVCLDPLPAAIELALDKDADFILCHHPLALKPKLPNQLDNYYKTLALVIRANVPLYAAHTSLDVNLAGPAGWLARALGLEHMEPLEPLPGFENMLGYGVAGDLPAPMPFAKLIESMLELLSLDCAFITGPEPDQQCRRIAYCGGSGASLIKAAAHCGAGLYITGDIKYHAALDAEIPVLDAGHHSLEEEMMHQMAELLAERLPETKIEFLPSASPFRMACK